MKPRLRSPFLLLILTVIAGLLFLTACQSPESKVPWKEVIQTETALYDIENAFQKKAIPYEAGKVSYRILIRNDLSQPQRDALAAKPENLEPSHILKKFRFHLGDIPMDFTSKAFPKSGHPLTGEISGNVVPQWILNMDEDLKETYALAQQEDMEAMYTFAKALYALENPFVPKLDPLGFHWLKLAADTGHGQAAYETAMIYFYGDEVAFNPDLGEAYMDLAAKLHNPEGLNYRAFETATLRVASTQQLRQARAFVRKALHSEPANPAYLDTLALLEARLGHWEKALKLQTRAVELYEERYTVEGILIVPEEEQETLDWVRKMEQAYRQKVIPQEAFYQN